MKNDNLQSVEALELVVNANSAQNFRDRGGQTFTSVLQDKIQKANKSVEQQLDSRKNTMRFNISSVRVTFTFSAQLFKDTFRRSGLFKEKEEMKIIKNSMMTKAWVTHLILMLSRVVFPVFGIAYWQKAFNERVQNNITELNENFIEKSEDTIKIGIWIMIVLGVLLDIMCWKYRQLSKLILYYELFSILWQGFVPFDYFSTMNIIYLMQFTLTFITVAVDMGPSVIACTICLLIL